jgi:HSP20 family molecular chaperone IbpA
MRHLVRITVACSAILALTSFKSSAAPPTSPAPSPFADVDLHMRQLDSQLDNIFTSTFRNFGNWFDQSMLSASIDLRDQKDKYVARVYLPGDENTSKVDARVENGALHITAEGEQAKNGATAGERFEQVMSLPGPVQSDKMHIDRKENLVVITLPKAAGTNTAKTTASTMPSTSAAPIVTNWDQSIVNEMARMQGRMDQIWQDAFPNDFMRGSSPLNVGSAVNVEDAKDHYVVRFYLPDRDLENVNVKLNNGQLQLSAKQQNESKSGNASSQSYAQYEQMVTMPGPVKNQGMKIDRKGSTIVVTVPKA